MDLTRRKTLAVLGGAATVGGTAFATGAFDAVSTSRGATVSVVNDADAYVAIRPIGDPAANPGGEYQDIQVNDGDDGEMSARRENPYASITDGSLELTFDGPPEVEATGLNKDGVSRFHYVFSVTNQGAEPVEVSLTAEETDSDEVTLYDSGQDGINDFDRELNGVDQVKLCPGDFVTIGVEFDPDPGKEAVEFNEVVVQVNETDDTCS